MLAQIYDLRAQAECAPLVNIRAINEQPGKESNLGELVVQVDVGEPLQVDGPRRQQLGGRGLLPLRSQPNTLFKVLYQPLNNLSDDPHPPRFSSRGGSSSSWTSLGANLTSCASSDSGVLLCRQRSTSYHVITLKKHYHQQLRNIISTPD